MFAAAKGYTDITRVLVQHGADPNAQNTVRIYSPLIDCSNNVIVISQEGMTALMMAVKGSWTAIVHILVDGHANVNIQENVSPVGLFLH